MFGINDRLKQLEAEGTPIRISLIGAGSMGMTLLEQVGMSPGMEADVVVDIHVENAIKALKMAGTKDGQIAVCDSVKDAEKALRDKKKVCTTNPELAWALPSIQVFVEATGHPISFARLALSAIRNKKHVVTYNVEGDVCIGHILKMFADNAGVVYTGIYGDEPGVVKALYDEAEALGFEIIAAGRHDMGGGKLEWNKENIVKALEGSEQSTQYNPAMFASFCDGSKTNEECCMLANATGLVPDIRGMHGPVVSYEEFIEQVPQQLDLKENGGVLSRTGVVERIMPPEGPIIQPIWCFVVVRAKTDFQKAFMGRGRGKKRLSTSNRLFYTPYHYTSIQAPLSIAYAFLYHQATICPKGDKRVADVIAIAKKDLAKGEIIDEIGGLCAAGRVERASIVKEKNFVPFALVSGGRLKKDIEKGQPLTYEDVELQDKEALIVQFRRLQENLFGVV
jgi:predicted homoserine dehydrogenase-like protein